MTLPSGASGPSDPSKLAFPCHPELSLCHATAEVAPLLSGC